MKQIETKRNVSNERESERNEIEQFQNETKRLMSKRNKTKRNQKKRFETTQSERNETIHDETKSNEMLHVYLHTYECIIQNSFEGVCFEYTHVIPGPGAKTVALTSDPETRNEQELQSGQKKASSQIAR